MKRAVIGGLVCVVGLAGPAVAADLRTKSPAVAAAPAWSWSGGYIGLHGGYGFGSADPTFHPWNGAFAPVSSAFSQDIGGGVFGFQIGQNWQIGSFLLGLETTTAWTGIDAKDSAVFAAFPNASYKTEIDNLSTFTPRLGFVNGPWLFYGKAGVAYGEVKTTLTNGGGQYFRETNDHVGWTAGVGLEYALTPNWIVGVEYNYVDLGEQHYGGAVNAALTTDFTHDVTLSTVLARLSYKFGAGGNPLVAAVLGPETPNGGWNGLYIGGHGGYAWGEAKGTNLVGNRPGGNADLDGGFGGGQIGYLSQIGNWVLGTEATISGGDIKGTFVDGNTGGTGEVSWFGTSTARLGYAVGPWQVYGKGGGAFGEVKTTAYAPNYTFSQSEYHIGWTFGGGLEYAWGNWLLGLEYNYVDLGKERIGGFGSLAAGRTDVNDDVNFSTVLARVSYKFSPFAPVVSKY